MKIFWEHCNFYELVKKLTPIELQVIIKETSSFQYIKFQNYFREFSRYWTYISFYTIQYPSVILTLNTLLSIHWGYSVYQEDIILILKWSVFKHTCSQILSYDKCKYQYRWTLTFSIFFNTWIFSSAAQTEIFALKLILETNFITLGPLNDISME